uniref:G protein-coupled receptor n=1 Tax=Caenorhabditis japonica TaxID=281687 RepID=A0A8R1ICJ7_CAEJA
MLIVFEIWHWIWAISGCGLNLLLVYVAVFKSPKAIRSYATLIINFAITDFVECFFDWFIQIRQLTYWLNFAPRDEVLPLARKWFPDYNFDEETGVISGILDVTSLWAAYGIFHLCFPIFPVYVAIFVLRRKIIQHLNANAAMMTKETKAAHSQLLRALTIQACIPAFMGIAVCSYLLGQSGVVQSPILEYTVFSALIMMPTLSPVTYLFFVKPYRQYLMRVFEKSVGKGGKGSTVSKTARFDSSGGHAGPHSQFETPATTVQ